MKPINFVEEIGKQKEKLWKHEEAINEVKLAIDKLKKESNFKYHSSMSSNIKRKIDDINNKMYNYALEKGLL